MRYPGDGPARVNRQKAEPDHDAFSALRTTNRRGEGQSLQEQKALDCAWQQFGDRLAQQCPA
jgi:hypothetical protein